MLRLLDRYPFQVEIKGAHVQFTSKLIVITSNKSPDSWYKCENSALLRRIDHIWLKNTLEDDFIVLKGKDPYTFINEYNAEIDFTDITDSDIRNFVNIDIIDDV